MTKPKKPEDKLPMGAPSKYKARFCRMLLAHMAGGLSFESFAGVVGVTNQTLYNWCDAHPDFLDTKKRAWELSRLWWEQLGIQGVQGLGPEVLRKRKIDSEGKIEEEYGAAQFNPTTWIFTMCNRFKEEWRQRNEVTGKDGEPLLPPIIPWSSLDSDKHVKTYLAEQEKAAAQPAAKPGGKVPPGLLKPKPGAGRAPRPSW